MAVEVGAKIFSDVEKLVIRVEAEKLSCDVVMFAVTWLWEVSDIL